MILRTIGAFFFSQLTWPSWNTRSVRNADEVLWYHVQKIFPHPESAIVIGKKYLQCASCEANVELLTKLIVSNPLPIPTEPEGEVDKIRNILRKKIRRDFLEDRVVTLDGWILSLTEVRLCSLVVMKTDKSFVAG